MTDALASAWAGRTITAGRAGKTGRLVSTMLALHHPNSAGPPHSRECSEPAAAAALLGEAHPLTVALTRCDGLLYRLWVLALVHIAGLVLWLGTPEVGMPLVVGAVLAELGLGGWWLLLVQERRGACRDLIAAGGEALPLDALARERDRLRSPRHQAELARSIARLTTRVSDSTRTARPPIDARVLSAAAPGLREIQRRMEAGEVSVRAVALVEQLISSPLSPLYGSDAGELTREIGRVQYLA